MRSGGASLWTGPGAALLAMTWFLWRSDTISDESCAVFFLSSQTKNLDFRRKWDKDEYEKLAEKRLTEEREKKDGGCLLHQSQGYRRGDAVAGEPMGSGNALSYYLAERCLPSPRLLFVFLMFKMRAKR